VIIVISEKQKRSLEKKWWRSTRKVLVKCRQPVVDKAQWTDPERLKEHVLTLMDVKPMTEHLIKLWSEVGGSSAFSTDKLIERQKSVIPNMELKIEPVKKLYWDEKLKKYASERSLIKAQAILTTEQEAINKVIDAVIQEGLDQGLGVADIRKLLTHDLEGEQMLEMENWQAQRIAMTEVGGANNTGSFMAASENSEGVKKIWMFVPGLKTFRENHQGFEALGPVDMDYEFAPGLKYPGDPNGTAEEVINCYCSLGYQLD
jgi:hypothetical protein